MNGPKPTVGSIARRRLLIALGFGVTNVAVLRRFRSGADASTDSGAGSPPEPQSEPGDPPTGSTSPDAGSGGATVVSEPAPPEQPPPVPVLDETAARGPDHIFDLAIVGGRVIDPASGFDFVASIGVSGSTVAAIAAGPDAAPLQASRTIDASGLVVSPGFIDILSYSPNGYGEWFKLADGVTANLGMHGLDNRADQWFGAHPDGSSPVHFGGAYDNAFVRQTYGLEPYDTAAAGTINAILEDARTDLRKGFIGLHMQPEYTPGTTADDLLGHAGLAADLQVPLCVHARYSDNMAPGTNLQAIGELVQAARETGAHVHVEHINAILEDARTDLRKGFIGLHMQPEYTPGTTADDLLGHAGLAADLQVPLCVHARYSDNMAPGTNLQAIGELVQAARETGAHVHVEHINSTGGTGVMAEALGRVGDAIDEGLAMTACVYPYEFWATYLKSARYEDWQEKYGISYGDLQVAGTSERLTEQTFGAAYADNSLTAAFAMSPEDIELPLRTDFVMVGSDAILDRSHNNHPRSTGCFSRVLGRYVRERSVIDLPTALSKMTIQPALLLERRCPGLRRKGRLGIGADADITVFDPATVADRSTIANPAQESVGIQWVVVEGRVVRSPDGATSEAPNGRGLRSDIGTA